MVPKDSAGISYPLWANTNIANYTNAINHTNTIPTIIESATPNQERYLRPISAPLPTEFSVAIWLP